MRSASLKGNEMILNGSYDPSCLICRKQRGLFHVPGGAVYENDLVFACHAHIPEGQSRVYLGWFVAETRRHIPGLAELSDGEAQALGLLVAHLSQGLKAEGAEHVYAFVLGHGVPHLHMHVIARYPGTPREYWGMRLDEWPDAPTGDEAQIAALAEKMRARLNRLLDQTRGA